MDNNIPRYSLLIFDFDGTLINSLDDIAWSLNEALSIYGYRSFTPDQVKQFIGFGTQELVRRALESAEPEKAARPDAGEVFNALLEIYRKNMVRTTDCYDGVRELLTLTKEKGLKNVILTNKNAKSSVMVARELGLTPLVEEVIGPETYGIKKPEPGVVHMLMERFNIDPGKTLFIGDMIVDVKTAQNAGISSVGATYGFGSPEQLEGADYLIDSFSELKNIIGL